MTFQIRLWKLLYILLHFFLEYGSYTILWLQASKSISRVSSITTSYKVKELSITSPYNFTTFEFWAVNYLEIRVIILYSTTSFIYKSSSSFKNKASNIPSSSFILWLIMYLLLILRVASYCLLPPCILSFHCLF